MALTKVTGSGADGLNLSSTDVTISSGDLLFATANKGVVLGVTSNTDGNTLDDYEEGLFTPVLGGENMTHNDRCRYTKIGRLVTLNFDATANASASTDEVISGLPFTPDGSYGSLHIAYATGGGIEGGYIGNSTDQIRLTVAGGTGADNLAANQRIIGSGTYFTDS